MDTQQRGRRNSACLGRSSGPDLLLRQQLRTLWVRPKGGSVDALTDDSRWANVSLCRSCAARRATGWALPVASPSKGEAGAGACAISARRSNLRSWNAPMQPCPACTRGHRLRPTQQCPHRRPGDRPMLIGGGGATVKGHSHPPSSLPYTRPRERLQRRQKRGSARSVEDPARWTVRTGARSGRQHRETAPP